MSMLAGSFVYVCVYISSVRLYTYVYICRLLKVSNRGAVCQNTRAYVHTHRRWFNLYNVWKALFYYAFVTSLIPFIQLVYRNASYHSLFLSLFRYVNSLLTKNSIIQRESSVLSFAFMAALILLLFDVSFIYWSSNNADSHIFVTYILTLSQCWSFLEGKPSLCNECNL